MNMREGDSMRSNYADEVTKILASLDDDNNNQETEPETEIPARSTPSPLREIHVIFVREEEEEEQDIIDSTVSDLDTAPLTARQPAATGDTGIVFFGAFVTLLCLFCIM